MNSYVRTHRRGQWQEAHIYHSRVVFLDSRLKSPIPKVPGKVRTIRTIWTFFCFVACVYHSYQVTSLYFQWDINAEAFFFPSDPLIPPMLTICFTREHFKTLCPEPLYKSTCLPFMGTPQKFFESTYSFDERFKSLTLTNPNGKDVTYAGNSLTQFKLNYVTTFKWVGYICYAIDFAKSFETKFYRHVAVQSHPVLVILLAMPPRDNVLVSVGPRGQIPDRLGGSAVQLTVVNGSNYVITYRKKELSLLPPPYPTNCRDYANEGVNGVKTREKCINECYYRKAIKSRNGTILIDKPIIQNYSSVNDDRKLELDVIEFGYGPQCIEQCVLIECDIEEYISRMSSVDINQSGDNRSAIALRLPFEADLKVNYTPKMTSWEYSTLFGSVFGLWFGVSVFDCEQLVKLWLARQKRLQSSRKSVILEVPRNVRSLRTVWTFILFMVTIYHSYQVTSIYFQWDISAEAFFFPKDPLIPPMVTVCLTQQHFKIRCPEPLANDKCLPFLRTPQKFFDNSYSFEELVAALIVSTPKGAQRVYFGSSITEFKRNYVTTFKSFENDICFSIDYVKSFKVQSYKVVDIQMQALPINLFIELNFVPNVKVLVTLSPRWDIPSKITGGTVEMSSLINGTAYLITYRKKELSLLPPPYATNCCDYANENVDGVRTREKCVLNCNRVQTMKVNSGKIPFGSLVVQNYSNTNDDRELETDRSSSKFVDMCRSKCHFIECVIDEYVAWNTLSMPFPGHNLGIALQLPSEADLKVIYKPNMTFWEYSTLFASVFGLWFGSSVLDCQQLVEVMLTRWIKSRQIQVV